MAKAWLALLLLTACGEDLHELGSCDPAWIGGAFSPSRCERACEQRPHASGSSCIKTSCEDGDGRACQVSSCPDTFKYDGVQGCCIGTPDGSVVQFYECE